MRTTKIRSSKLALVFLAIAAMIAVPALAALADNTVADGDGVTPLTDNPNMAFGTVGCDVASDKSSLIAISRQGSATGTNAFANNATVTVTAAASGNTALSASVNSPGTITLPSDWTSKSNGTLSDSVQSTVTVDSSVEGPGSGTVTYTATGKNTSGATIDRTDTVNVSWTTGACDSTAPSVNSISAADANPTKTSDPLNWTVTFNEDVTGVDTGDFALVNSGLGGSPIISSVAPVGTSKSVYTVTASSGSGSGNLGLKLNDNDSIVDGAGNKLGGEGTGTAGSGGAGNGSFNGDTYVIDRTAPTVTATATKGPNFTDAYAKDTWSNKDVRVTFACADLPLTGTPGASGLTSGSANEVDNFTSETSGATATFDGTCADNAGNTAAAASFGLIKIDKSAPTNIAFSGGGLTNGASYNFGSVPAGPSDLCTANGDISGLKSCTTDAATTYKTTVGTHIITATAEDNAGNKDTKTLTYTVDPWNATGFYSPVGTSNSEFISLPDTLPTTNDSGVWNIIKGGSTVPLKFNVYSGSTEQTNTTAIKSFTAQKISCSATEGSTIGDPVDFTTTETTSLRYSGTPGVDGQFIQNWKTTKVSSETCYRTAVTLADGSSIYAFFKLLR